MAQIYSTIPEDERLDRSCSIDVDVIDKKTGRRAIIALAALAFAAGAIVSTMPASATYTAPNYNYGYPNGITTRAKTATVTAFIDDKWYQSSFKLAICTTDC